MKKFYIVFILTLFCQINNIDAQSKTPYENKREEISIKFLKKMGVSINEIKQTINADKSGLLLILLIGEKMQQYKYTNELKFLILNEEWKKELKDAEKLKNSVDFEKERKEKEKIKEEKKKIEDEEKNKEKIKQWVHSDLHKILINIRMNYEEWAKKGEFETSEEYNERMLKKYLVFDSLSFSELKNAVDYSINEGKYSLELKEYNSDQGIYPFLFRKLISLPDYEEKIIEIEDTFKLSVGEAKQLKQSVNIQEDKENGKIYNRIYYANDEWPSSIQFTEDLNYWTIFEDNLFPKTFIISKMKHDLCLKSKSISEFKIETNLLGLNNYFQENYVFKLIDYFGKIKEQKIKSAINIASKEYLNGSLDKALELYLEINSTKEIDSITKKIVQIENELKEIKIKKLTSAAELLKSKGLLSKSIEKYEEVNLLKESNEILQKILIIKEEIENSLEKHLLIDSSFKKLDYIKSNLLLNSISYENLEEFKKGYGDKYRACMKIFENEIINNWNVILSEYNRYLNQRNVEVWDEKYHDLSIKFMSFQEQLNVYSKFQESVNYFV